MNCLRCRQISITIINILFVACAGILMAKSAYLINKRPLTVQYTFLNSFNIFVAAVKVACSGIGCYAIWQNNTPLECLYATFLVVMFCLYAGLLSYFGIRIQNDLNLVQDQSYFFELLQTGHIRYWELRYGCCGYNGWKDYEDLNKPIAGSCCGLKEYTLCMKDIAVKKMGCAEALTKNVYRILIPGSAFIATILVLELIALAILICPRINNEDTDTSDFSFIL